MTTISRGEEIRQAAKWGRTLPESERFLVEAIAHRHRVDSGIIWMAYYAGNTACHRLEVAQALEHGMSDQRLLRELIAQDKERKKQDDKN